MKKLFFTHSRIIFQRLIEGENVSGNAEKAPEPLKNTSIKTPKIDLNNPDALKLLCSQFSENSSYAERYHEGIERTKQPKINPDGTIEQEYNFGDAKIPVTINFPKQPLDAAKDVQIFYNFVAEQERDPIKEGKIWQDIQKRERKLGNVVLITVKTPTGPVKVNGEDINLMKKLTNFIEQFPQINAKSPLKAQNILAFGSSQNREIIHKIGQDFHRIDPRIRAILPVDSPDNFASALDLFLQKSEEKPVTTPQNASTNTAQSSEVSSKYRGSSKKTTDTAQQYGDSSERQPEILEPRVAGQAILPSSARVPSSVDRQSKGVDTNTTPLQPETIKPFQGATSSGSSISSAIRLPEDIGFEPEKKERFIGKISNAIFMGHSLLVGTRAAMKDIVENSIDRVKEGKFMSTMLTQTQDLKNSGQLEKLKGGSYFLMGGINDLMAGKQPDEIFDYIKKCCDIVTEEPYNIKPVLFTVPPFGHYKAPNSGPNFTEKTNKAREELNKKIIRYGESQGYTVIKLHLPLSQGGMADENDSNTLHSDFLSKDGLHPAVVSDKKNKGYNLMASLIVKNFHQPQ